MYMYIESTRSLHATLSPIKVLVIIVGEGVVIVGGGVVIIGGGVGGGVLEE